MQVDVVPVIQHPPTHHRAVRLGREVDPERRPAAPHHLEEPVQQTVSVTGTDVGDAVAPMERELLGRPVPGLETDVGRPGARRVVRDMGARRRELPHDGVDHGAVPAHDGPARSDGAQRFRR
jgi:hypothetical protein